MSTRWTKATNLVPGQRSPTHVVPLDGDLKAFRNSWKTPVMDGSGEHRQLEEKIENAMQKNE